MRKEREGGRVQGAGILVWLSWGGLVFVIGRTWDLVRVGVSVGGRVRVLFLLGICIEWWVEGNGGWWGLVGTRVGCVPAVIGGAALVVFIGGCGTAD